MKILKGKFSIFVLSLLIFSFTAMPAMAQEPNGSNAELIELLNEILAKLEASSTAPVTVGPTAQMTTTVLVDSLNVRSTPVVTDNNIVGSLPMGAVVTVLETDPTGWHKIYFNGVTAWIAANPAFVAVTANTVTLPVEIPGSGPAPVNQPVQAGTCAGMTQVSGTFAPADAEKYGWAPGIYMNQPGIELVMNERQRAGTGYMKGEIYNVLTTTVEIQVCIDPAYATNHTFTNVMAGTFFPLDTGNPVGIVQLIQADGSPHAYNVHPGRYGLGPAQVPVAQLNIASMATGTLVMNQSGEACEGFYDLQATDGWSHGLAGDTNTMNSIDAEQARATAAGEMYIPGQIMVTEVTTVTMCIAPENAHGIVHGLNAGVFWGLPSGGYAGTAGYADGHAYVFVLPVGRYALGRASIAELTALNGQ